MKPKMNEAKAAVGFTAVVLSVSFFELSLFTSSLLSTQQY